MQIQIDYNERYNTAVIKNLGVTTNLWDDLTRLFRNIYQTEVSTGATVSFDMPWRSFLRAEKNIRWYCRLEGIDLAFTPEAAEKTSHAYSVSYQEARRLESVSEADLKAKLIREGFTRAQVLTANQVTNLMKIANLPAAATFSVPGAGKTTEALAYFFYNAEPTDSLLVVAPKSALISWDKELKSCAESCREHFVRLQGGVDKIKKLLEAKPRFSIISYQQFPRVEREIADYLNRNEVFMFLDESHRIKAGHGAQSAKAILDVSNLPKRKLVMSGTPMPQSPQDLVPQFNYLYPEEHASPERVVDLFRPIFVRTTAGQLGIPNIKYYKEYVQLNELQRKVYESIKETTARELRTFHITDFSRDNLKRIGKSIMKVLQFVSNPALLSDDISFIYNQKMAQVLSCADGPKMARALRLAREIVAKKHEKVIIWSTFVKNVELISFRLKDLGANFIDGSVPTGDISDPSTREYRIDKFLNDKNCNVLVANPSACAESISLHSACHNAIYLDRSFNAAHFMQSEDRIHRLGLKETPNVYILECEDTVDQVVEKRLSEKIKNMSVALNDPSIMVTSFETCPESEEDDDCTLEEDQGIDEGDYRELLKYFFGDDQ